MNIEIEGVKVKQEPDGSIKICPVDGAICDRKCGYQFHGTVNRAVKDSQGLKDLENLGGNLITNQLPKSQRVIHIPEDPADANICDGCE